MMKNAVSGWRFLYPKKLSNRYLYRNSIQKSFDYKILKNNQLKTLI